jgi:hypothetical protein
MAGWPDIIGAWEGNPLALEVKRPGVGRLTRLQEMELERWKAAGAITGVVTSIGEVKDLLKGERNNE